MTHERLKKLMDLYVNRSATTAEEDELFDLLNQPECEAQVREWLAAYIEQPKANETLPADSTASILKSVLKTQETSGQVQKSRKNGMYALASALAVGICVFLFIDSVNKRAQPATTGIINNNDVVPGSYGATLTLSDGRQIILDTLQNGLISSEKGAAVELRNGNLLYDKGNVEGSPVYNTLSTPKGRQFHVQLPDGSNVWLNAASSIRYPVVFNAVTRDVQITGEAYFEVATMPDKPFIVHIGEQSTVEVLGTHFNVNTYADEDKIKATLLEGRVKVHHASRTASLKPGQQAAFNNNGDGDVARMKQKEKSNGDKIIVTDNTDLSQVIAWKDGVFNLNGVSFAGLMRQISRWYDIDIVYENGIPDLEFSGKMGRDVSLKALLYFLDGSGIKFRIEKETKKLILIK